MLGKKFLLLTLIVLISLLPSFSEDITREFTITAVLPNTSGEETYSISVVDIRDGTISNAINKGDGIDLGRAVDLITGYKDMFAIDYTSNSTGPVTITVTLSPASKENDASSYIEYDYKCTPSMAFSSSDLTDLTPQDEWIKDGKSNFYGYSLKLPTEHLGDTITSFESTNEYNFVVNENYYQWVDVTQHYTGWVAFLHSKWQFPILLTDKLTYPENISIFWTDSNPLFSIIFKILAPLYGYADIQFIGFYSLLSLSLIFSKYSAMNFARKKAKSL